MKPCFLHCGIRFFKDCFVAFLSCAFLLCSFGATLNAQGTTTGKVTKTDQQWRQQLDALSYNVTRQKGTETAYTGKYWNSKKDGIYVCKCCGQKLFDSKTKFDSNTGWPSYFQPIAPKVITNVKDLTLGMNRIETVCSRCDAHLGHVFNDGPQPTGLRYCMNSCALVLKPRNNVVQAAGQQNAKQALPTGFETPQKLMESLSVAIGEKSVQKIVACLCLHQLPKNTRAQLSSVASSFGSNELASMQFLMINEVPKLQKGLRYNLSVEGAIEAKYKNGKKAIFPYGKHGGRYLMALAIPE